MGRKWDRPGGKSSARKGPLIAAAKVAYSKLDERKIQVRMSGRGASLKTDLGKIEMNRPRVGFGVCGGLRRTTRDRLDDAMGPNFWPLFAASQGPDNAAQECR